MDGGGRGVWAGEDLEEEVERVEMMFASRGNEAHEDGMVASSFFRAIAKGDFSEDDIVAQDAFGPVVVGAHIFKIQTSHQFLKTRQ